MVGIYLRYMCIMVKYLPNMRSFETTQVSEVRSERMIYCVMYLFIKVFALLVRLFDLSRSKCEVVGMSALIMSIVKMH